MRSELDRLTALRCALDAGASEFELLALVDDDEGFDSPVVDYLCAHRPQLRPFFEGLEEFGLTVGDAIGRIAAKRDNEAQRAEDAWQEAMESLGRST